LVRNISDKDYTQIESFFKSNDNVIQLQTCFIGKAKINSGMNISHYDIDKSGVAYFCKKEYEFGKSNFSAVGVFKISRVRNLLGEFSVGELRNSNLARSKGISMGRAIFPFANWLPFPEAYRAGRKRLFMKAVEKFSGAGVFPIDY